MKITVWTDAKDLSWQGASAWASSSKSARWAAGRRLRSAFSPAQPPCAAPSVQVTLRSPAGCLGTVWESGAWRITGELRMSTEAWGGTHRIGFSGIAREKASVSTAGSQTHCKDFFLRNCLLKQGPKGTFTLCEPTLRGSHSMGFASSWHWKVIKADTFLLWI